MTIGAGVGADTVETDDTGVAIGADVVQEEHSGWVLDSLQASKTSVLG